MSSPPPGALETMELCFLNSQGFGSRNGTLLSCHMDPQAAIGFQMFVLWVLA